VESNSPNPKFPPWDSISYTLAAPGAVLLSQWRQSQRTGICLRSAGLFAQGAVELKA